MDADRSVTRRACLAALGAAAGCSGRPGWATDGPGGASAGTARDSGTPPASASSAGGATPDSGPDRDVDGEVRFDADLFEPLRAGGYTVYVRHAATEDTSEELRESGPDDEFFADCSVQRNLSPTGRAQAHEIGYAVDALSIPVGRVESSRYCRCRDTARLAFGRVTPTPDLTWGVANGRERRLDRITAPPEPGRNAVLVSHTLSGIDLSEFLLGDLTLGEGDAAVFDPDRTPAEALVGIVRVDAWRAATMGG